MVQNIQNNQKEIKVGKIIEKYDILRVEDKIIPIILNKTKNKP